MTATNEQPQAEPHSAWWPRLTRLDWVLLALVIGIAIFFRFWQMGHIPPGMDFDEAFESLEARRILTQPGYHPIFFPGNNGVPAVKIYLTALAFLVAGEQMLAIRYISAIIGTLTVPGLYLLARVLFPLPTEARFRSMPAERGASAAVRSFLPFIASFLLAILPWHTAFSRRGVEVVLLPLWAILAAFFLWQGLTTRRWWLFAVSGVFWGSAAYTYQAAWFLPGALVFFLVYKAFQERGFLRRYGWGLLLLALVSLLVMLPLIQFGYHNSSVLFQRTTQVGLLGQGQGGEAPLVNLARNALKVAGVFVLGGDPNASDQLTNRPPLPFAVAATLLLGLLIALRRFKRARVRSAPDLVRVDAGSLDPFR